MKRITIAAVVLLLLGAGFYFVNKLAADKAAEEINAILTPKLEEVGIEYEELEVNPAAGILTFRNIESENGEVSAQIVSVQSTLEDLLAAAKGTPDFLHGLTLHVENFAAGEGDERISLEVGDLVIDALIDIKTLQRDPETWAMELMQQRDVSIEVGGTGWTIRNREMTRDLNLPSALLRLDEVGMTLDKENDKGEVTMRMDSPDYGKVEMLIKGDEQKLERLEMEINDLLYPVGDDGKIRLGQAALTMSGTFPVEAIEDEGWEDLFMTGMAMEWELNLKDAEIEGRELRKSDFPSDRLSISSLDHRFNFSGKSLVADASFESNLTGGTLNLDLTMDSMEPTDMRIETLALEFHDVEPTIAAILDMSPMQSTTDGYDFTYVGPLMGLLAALP